MFGQLSGFKSFVIFAVVFLTFNNCLIGPQAHGQSGQPDHAATLAGIWRGTYECAATRTGAIVEMTPAGRGTYSAVFSFHPLDGRPRAATSGSFKATVNANRPDGGIMLQPTAWIEKPPGYVLVGFRGTLSPDGRTIEGSMFAPCSRITLARDGRPRDSEQAPVVTSSRPSAPVPATKQAPPRAAVPAGGQEKAEPSLPWGVVKVTQWTDGEPSKWELVPNEALTAAARYKMGYPKEDLLCQAVPKSEFPDCSLGTQHSRFASSIGLHPKASLREVCKRALQKFDKASVTECIVGEMRSSSSRNQNDSYTSFSGILTKERTCVAFMTRVFDTFERFNPGEARFLYLSKQTPAPTSDLCLTFTELQADRGLANPSAGCGQGSRRPEILAGCVGFAATSSKSTEVWKQAIAACEQGTRIQLVDSIRGMMQRAGVQHDPNVNCLDVRSVATLLGIASEELLSAMIAKDEALKGQRPPRDADIQAAFLAALGAQLGCDARRGRNCPLSQRTDPREAVAQGVTDVVMDKIMEGVDPSAKSGDYRTNVRESIFVGMHDIVLKRCEKSGASTYICSYDVVMGCRVRGKYIFRGIDMDGPSMEERICPPLRSPTARSTAFEWKSDQLQMNGSIFAQ